VLTNLYHDRQLYNTLIPPLHESPAVGLRISRLSGSVELTLRYTTPDIHCRHRRHECDGGIKRFLLLLASKFQLSSLSLDYESPLAFPTFSTSKFYLYFAVAGTAPRHAAFGFHTKSGTVRHRADFVPYVPCRAAPDPT